MENSEKFANRKLWLQGKLDQVARSLGVLLKRLPGSRPQLLLWSRRALALGMMAAAVLAIRYMVAHYPTGALEELHVYHSLKAYLVVLAAVVLWIFPLGFGPVNPEEEQPGIPTQFRILGVSFDLLIFQLSVLVLGFWWATKGDDSIALTFCLLAVLASGLIYWLGTQRWGVVTGLASLLLLGKLGAAATISGQAEVERTLQELEQALADMNDGYLTVEPYFVLLIISAGFTPLRMIRLGKRFYGGLPGDFSVPVMGGRRVHLFFASALVFGGVFLGFETFLGILRQLPSIAMG